VFENKIIPNLMVVAALLYSLWESFTIQAMTGMVGFSSSQMRIGPYLYALSLLAHFYTFKNYYTDRTSSVLVQIGNYSFGLFFLHTFYLTGINKILSFVQLPDFFYVPVIVAGAGAVLLFTYGTIRIAEKLIGERVLKFIGI
jgi:peptidoglycan/LPS O-acetylase OafA/YrhL